MASVLLDSISTNPGMKGLAADVRKHLSPVLESKGKLAKQARETLASRFGQLCIGIATQSAKAMADRPSLTITEATALGECGFIAVKSLEILEASLTCKPFVLEGILYRLAKGMGDRHAVRGRVCVAVLVFCFVLCTLLRILSILIMFAEIRSHRFALRSPNISVIVCKDDRQVQMTKQHFTCSKPER
jgi:hypothetical protein